MNSEIVFEIGGEGGVIRISRISTTTGDKFIYHHNEFDPTEEGLDVNFKNAYRSFEEAFQVINEKYKWHILFILSLHEDYKNYVAEKLVEKLNSNPERTGYFQKERWEEVMGIKLNYQREKHEWSVKKNCFD